MQRFREKTMDNFCVMGSKTWESLPKPLKGRTNVILTRNVEYPIDPHLHNEYEIIAHNDLNKIINHYNSGIQERNLMCIGGAEIYRQMLPHTDRVYLTLFHDDSKEADTYFPLEYLEKHFEIESRVLHKEEGLEFEFIDYVRKENVDGEG